MANRVIRTGTKRQRRCHNCGRKIGTGREYKLDGHYYGSECIYRVLDRLNSKGVSA